MALILPLGIDARGAAVGAKGWTVASTSVSKSAGKATKSVVILDKATTHLGVTSTKIAKSVSASAVVMGTAFNGIGASALGVGRSLKTISGLATAAVVPGMAAMAATGATVATSFNGIGMSAMTAGAQVEASMVKATAATSAMNFVMRNFLSIMAGVVVVRSMVNTIADFELTLIRVKGVTNASAEELRDLTQTARDLGATTVFSATEAGEGLLFLARAGFNVAESIEALPATLNLAAAGQIELGASADLASNVLRQFGLEAEETTRVVDALLRVTNQANTDITQIGEAMKFAGPIAGALGKTVEETAVMIGLLGDAGIQASLAGTNLRGTLLALASPTDGARKAMEELGLSALDLNPAVNSMESIFAAFSAAGLKAGQAAQIFGRRNASAALILSRAHASIGENVAALEEMNSAMTIAEQNNKTLAGEFKALKSAIQELFLVTGDKGLGGILKSTVILFTDVTRVMAGMDTALRSNEFAVRALATVIEFLLIRLAALVALNVISMLGSLAKHIVLTTLAMRGFNVAVMANPIGLMATAAALAITTFIALKSHMAETANLARDLQTEFADMTSTPLRNLDSFGDDFNGKIKTAEEGVKRLTKMLQLMRAEGPSDPTLQGVQDLRTAVAPREFSARIRASTGQPFEGVNSFMGRDEAASVINRQIAILNFARDKAIAERKRQTDIDTGAGFEGTLEKIQEQTRELGRQADALFDVEKKFKDIDVIQTANQALSKAGIDPRRLSEDTRLAAIQKTIDDAGVTTTTREVNDLKDAVAALGPITQAESLKIQEMFFAITELAGATKQFNEAQTSKALKEYTADLDFQIATMKMSNEEVEQAIVFQEAFNAVIEVSGSKATTAAAQFASAQVDKIKRLQAEDKARAIAEEAENKALADREQTLGSIANALGDIAIEGRNAADVIKDLGRQLAKLAIRNAFMSFFPSGSGATPGGAPGTPATVSTPTTSAATLLPSILAPESGSGQKPRPGGSTSVTIHQTFIDKARDNDSFKRNRRSNERDLRDSLNK